MAKPSRGSTKNSAANSIGKEGITGGEVSTEGGQYDFMPTHYSGAREPDAKAGQSTKSTNEPYDFLPPAGSLSNGLGRKGNRG